MAKFEIKNGVAIIPEDTTEIGYAALEGCTSLDRGAVFGKNYQTEQGRL